jgi:hypothetical protein
MPLVQLVPEQSQRGKPAAVNEKVEAIKKTKGKDFCSDNKRMPPEVKNAPGSKTMVAEDEVGFSGQKVMNLKTGKAKQFYQDGSYFDGFMLNDQLVRGRFYFSNGDFYQGYFEEGQPAKGNFIQAAGFQFCTIKNDVVVKKGAFEGLVEAEFLVDGTKKIFKGNFVNEKPSGEVTIDGVAVQSPWVDGELQTEQKEELPQQPALVEGISEADIKIDEEPEEIQRPKETVKTNSIDEKLPTVESEPVPNAASAAISQEMDKLKAELAEKRKEVERIQLEKDLEQAKNVKNQ